MNLSDKTFDYLMPTPSQTEASNQARACAAAYALSIENLVPDGPDRDYAMRKLREVAMWVNVAITRLEDGSARPSTLDEKPGKL